MIHRLERTSKLDALEERVTQLEERVTQLERSVNWFAAGVVVSWLAFYFWMVVR